MLHIIPFSSFGSETALDPKEVAGKYLPPLWHNGFSDSYNVDGYVTTSQKGDAVSYLQVFRSGIVETAAGDVRTQVNGGTNLYANELEVEVVNNVKTSLSALLTARIPPPFLIMLGALGVAATKVVGNPLKHGIDPSRLRYSEHFPVVRVDDYGEEADYAKALRPIFDAFLERGRLLWVPKLQSKRGLEAPQVDASYPCPPLRPEYFASHCDGASLANSGSFSNFSAGVSSRVGASGVTSINFCSGSGL